jgi:NADH dehydrogenase FAD-containing subunit
MVSMTRAFVHLIIKVKMGQVDPDPGSASVPTTIDRQYQSLDASRIPRPRVTMGFAAHHRRPRRQRKVVIVGGGPAGMEKRRGSGEH